MGDALGDLSVITGDAIKVHSNRVLSEGMMITIVGNANGSTHAM